MKRLERQSRGESFKVGDDDVTRSAVELGWVSVGGQVVLRTRLIKDAVDFVSDLSDWIDGQNET